MEIQLRSTTTTILLPLESFSPFSQYPLCDGHTRSVDPVIMANAYPSNTTYSKKGAEKIDPISRYVCI